MGDHTATSSEYVPALYYIHKRARVREEKETQNWTLCVMKWALCGRKNRGVIKVHNNRGMRTRRVPQGCSGIRGVHLIHHPLTVVHALKMHYPLKLNHYLGAM